MNATIAKKKQIIERLLRTAEARLKEIKRAAKDARLRANEAEGAMQSRYDTFKEEGQNLAGGLKIREIELVDTVATMREILAERIYEQTPASIGLYTLVTVDFEDGEEKRYFIFPVFGGEVVLDSTMVVTPLSPIGRALLDDDDAFEVSVVINGQLRKGEIVDWS